MDSRDYCLIHKSIHDYFLSNLTGRSERFSFKFVAKGSPVNFFIRIFNTTMNQKRVFNFN